MAGRCPAPGRGADPARTSGRARSAPSARPTGRWDKGRTESSLLGGRPQSAPPAVKGRCSGARWEQTGAAGTKRPPGVADVSTAPVKHSSPGATGLWKRRQLDRDRTKRSGTGRPPIEILARTRSTRSCAVRHRRASTTSRAADRPGTAASSSSASRTSGGDERTVSVTDTRLYGKATAQSMPPRTPPRKSSIGICGRSFSTPAARAPPGGDRHRSHAFPGTSASGTPGWVRHSKDSPPATEEGRGGRALERYLVSYQPMSLATSSWAAAISSSVDSMTSTSSRRVSRSARACF